VPYVRCPGCELRTYSAALWSGWDDCPSCGTRLPVERSRVAGGLNAPAGVLAGARAPLPRRANRAESPG